MAKLADDIAVRMLLVGFVLVVGYLWLSGPGSPLQSYGVGGISTLEAAMSASGVCPVDGASNVCFSAKNTVAEPDTALAVTANLYTNGKTTPSATLTTLTTADICSNDTVNCKNGEAYRGMLGDGPTQYLRYADATDTGTWTTADHAIMRHDVPMYVVGSATVLASNASTFSQPFVTVTLGSGQDDGTTSLRISEATADAYYSVPGQEYSCVVCFNFSTNNFTSVHLSGAGVTQNIRTNTIASGYEMCDGYKAPNDLVDWAWVEIPVVIDVIAGVDPSGDAIASAQPTNISIMTFDWATWNKDGNIMYGVQNGDTLAAIGAADVTSTQIIRVY